MLARCCLLAAAAWILLTMVFLPGTPPAVAAGTVTYTYSVATRGSVRSEVPQFAARAQGTLDDSRGWGLGGSIRFVRVASGGSFTLWLAQASLVPSFGFPCSSFYSCHVGRNVIINDDRWSFGSPYLRMAVEDYRDMVINHESGHWLGFGHRSCPGTGQPAYVMQQQSKGGTSLGSCLPNAWPRPEERSALAASRGVPIHTAVPFGSLDAVAPAQNGIDVSGWAIDPNTTAPIEVQVFVNGVYAAGSTANRSRPDVDAAFGMGANHGFDLFLPTWGGKVCVFALSSGGGSRTLVACRNVPATAAPFGYLDAVVPAPNGVTVSGWALDPDTPLPILVQAYVNGVSAAGGTASGSRPDVDAAFGKGPDHGFNLFVPTGGGNLCLYALNYGGGPNPRIACTNV